MQHLPPCNPSHHSSEPSLYMTIDDIVAMTTLSRSTIYRMIRAEKFPPPIKPTDGRAARWPRAEVEAWRIALERAR